MRKVSHSMCLLATLGLAAQGAPAYAQASPPAPTVVEVRVIVKDRSSNKPLNAAIYSRINCPNYNDACLAVAMHTSSRSPSKLSCPQGAQIYARISISGYYRQSSAETCFPADEPIELFVARYEDADWLKKAGVDLEKKGNTAEATVLFNEAFQVSRSQDTFELTLRSAAKALAADPEKAVVFDPLQNRLVASKELVDAIKTFQKSQGILEDGVLGPQTLQKLGGGRPSSDLIMYFAVQPPSN